MPSSPLHSSSKISRIVYTVLYMFFSGCFAYCTTPLLGLVLLLGCWKQVLTFKVTIIYRELQKALKNTYLLTFNLNACLWLFSVGLSSCVSFFLNILTVFLDTNIQMSWTPDCGVPNCRSKGAKSGQSLLLLLFKTFYCDLKKIHILLHYASN
jgi:hypothetical protein